ncbi:amidohydrolase family protein [Subtercola boreus]|uniref:Cytosine deaminase n=1 Tax=Subtercola boreus TaxID=120213 RepID=A0A3E0WD26_9MICO|nr:amidohydrolase family protein [Subtercola boreus]RFA21996.1 cytosine deaminase [Subtercola boreus]RFA22176.1 cytosine deaminase [Subtercola boreus]RFA28038.1 cytosine deaminase [Subtercola boreus]
MNALPRRVTLLQNATLPDGSTCDVRLDGDTVGAIGPAHSVPVEAGGDTLDLTGFLLLTAPADPHAHLDKALSWDAIDPPMGDLVSAILAWRAYAQTMTTESIVERARKAALLMLRQGTTAVRSHVDVLLGDEPLRGVRAILQVREELRDLMHIEIVALAGSDVPDADIEAAIDLGVDLVGGSPHLAIDPSADLQRLLRLAERKGVGVDIHTDENLTGALTLAEFAQSVRDWPTERNRSAGHCVRLGTLQQDDLAAVLDEVEASDVGIIANPITNLYLQGWEHPVSTPRGLTAARAVLDRGGIRFAAGADNVRDPFNPVGRSDALETASLLVIAGHLTLDEAYTAVSDGARAVMALPSAGVAVGARAELLAIRATNLSDAVANASADRYVIHAGNLVAQSTVTYDVALPSPARQPSLLQTR